MTDVEASLRPEAPVGGEQAGLFLRKSSGLVRELGWRDTFSMAVGGGNPSFSVLSFAAFFAFVSNVELTWPYLIALVIMLPICFVYGQLVATMPRSGGDFIYVSRIFHPLVGAAVGVGFLVWAFNAIAGNAIGLASLGMPEAMRVAANAFSSGTLAHFSSSLASNTTTQFIVGTISVVITFAIAALGPRAITRTVFWCFIAGVLGIIALVIVGFTHSSSDLTAAYNHATAPNAYSRVIAAAHSNGVATGSSFSGFLKYLPYAAIGYFGFTAANYPAGELKRKGTIYTSMTIAGLVATGVCIVLAWLAVEHLTGRLFFQSVAGLNAANPDALTHITNGNGSSVAVYYPDLVTSHVPALIISWGVAIGYLIFNLAFALVVSRLIFALSFDRLLPAWFADVNERTHVPTKALVLGLAGCVLFTYLVAEATGYAHAARNNILVWSVVLTLASLAVTVLPWRRPELFQAGPKVLKGQVAGIPVIVVIGAVSTVIQAALGVIAATNTGISGGYDAVSVAVLLTMLLLGVVFYVVSRTYLKRRRGIDIDLAMRELPPE